jgi:hypothetical protein
MQLPKITYKIVYLEKDNPSILYSRIFSSKEDLIKQAEEDNFKGGLRVQSSRTGGIYVIYKSGVTGFQALASGASNRTVNPLG